MNRSPGIAVALIYRGLHGYYQLGWSLTPGSSLDELVVVFGNLGTQEN